MELTDKILHWIEILRTKPKMIIPLDDIDYIVLTTYIEGYFEGISVVIGTDINKAITNWFQETVSQKTSFYWTKHIASYYEEKTDEELKSIALMVASEYFRSNPIIEQAYKGIL